MKPEPGEAAAIRQYLEREIQMGRGDLWEAAISRYLREGKAPEAAGTPAKPVVASQELTGTRSKSVAGPPAPTGTTPKCGIL